ncbi:MAG: hypothetical protein IJU65_09660 [Desulfovibrio sp.]|nr:hypothetical protein [Desulfovibrio sp.]
MRAISGGMSLDANTVLDGEHDVLIDSRATRKHIETARRFFEKRRFPELQRCDVHGTFYYLTFFQA